MKSRKKIFWTTIVLGFISFLILILYYLALTDIWHENGRPDFWHGQGPAALEWKLLAIGFWPMLIFHILFFISAYKLFARREPR